MNYLLLLLVFSSLGYSEEYLKSFYQHCTEPSNKDTAYTVSIMLDEAKTNDCKLADKYFFNTKSLYLAFFDIKDLSPLESLTHLEKNSLQGNKIEDIYYLKKFSEVIYFNMDDNSLGTTTDRIENNCSKFSKSTTISDWCSPRRVEFLEMCENPKNKDTEHTVRVIKRINNTPDCTDLYYKLDIC